MPSPTGHRAEIHLCNRLDELDRLHALVAQFSSTKKTNGSWAMPPTATTASTSARPPGREGGRGEGAGSEYSARDSSQPIRFGLASPCHPPIQAVEHEPRR
jgi:hypothetical protein